MLFNLPSNGLTKWFEIDLDLSVNAIFNKFSQTTLEKLKTSDFFFLKSMLLIGQKYNNSHL